MLRSSVRLLLSSAGVLLLALAPACSNPMPAVDAGAPVVVDAGAPVACTKPEGCRDQGLSSVCREGFCNPDVPCGSDFECGLGERCLRGRCAFTGCTKNADCATGLCLGDTYTCVECATNGDCPRDRPVCNVETNSCQSCRTDAECTVPGPARCGPGGRCVHCLVNDDCPSGLSCGPSNLCVGAARNQPCPEGVACGAGLSCVQLAGNRVCLPTCNLYQPRCEMGEICFRLTYASSNALVFESQGPIGVCFASQPGFRGPRELCQRNQMGSSNCQPNLQCVPESASTALCRTYCNPMMSGGCVSTERCVSFPGDSNGRRYGLCLPDNGFGAACSRDSQCRANLSCQPYDDPSTFDDLSPICQFSVGTGAGLSPCAPRPVDGGVVPADFACRSGACREDPLSGSTRPYFCFAACEQDSDCTIGARTGVCDGTFTFTSAFGTVGTVKGCRPGCDSEAACESYDAGVTCRARLLASATEPKLSFTCSPPLGQLRAGEACTTSSQCKSGLCQLDDSRGVRRRGACLEPCTPASGCAPTDGGLSTSCLATSVLASRGFDGQPNTPDDRLLSAPLCAGPGCSTTQDCQVDGGAPFVCAPMVQPSGPLVSLRCLPPTTGPRSGGQPCSSDVECQSGVCGALQSPSMGMGSVCFEACTATSTCPAGTTCRAQGLRITTTRGPASVDACAP